MELSPSSQPGSIKLGWYVERGFSRLYDRNIAFPAFVFQFEVLNGYGVGISIEVRKGLVLRYPAAIDVVGDHLLSRLVIYLQNDVLPEVLQRDFGSELCTQLPNLSRPKLEAVS